VSVQAGHFSVGGEPQRFVGANLWYAAYLGADAPFGDRERLKRELDRLRAVGVTNLRILAASEQSPLRSAVQPAFHNAHDHWDPALLKGLDFTLAEMNKRGQRAVLYLTNFWEWSGGMATYLGWNNGGHYVDVQEADGAWVAFADSSSTFYGAEAAVAQYHKTLCSLVLRENSITGQRYADDPIILSWQLANEPRPGASPDVVERHMEGYCAWIRASAALIKSLDPHHLVSTGSEGLVGSGGCMDHYERAHAVPDVDYLTVHIWPQNWGWATPLDLEGTFAEAASRAQDYLQQHIASAVRLGRPLVIEEFGFPRDLALFARSATTRLRDDFYRIIYDAVLESARTGGPLAGSNFWAFGGQGAARHADYRMRPGDSDYMGDPPHEPQGWYSVFDTDHSTLQLVSDHARALSR
jgi:mannan endo-1,4-beta-mannosidase